MNQYPSPADAPAPATPGVSQNSQTPGNSGIPVAPAPFSAQTVPAGRPAVPAQFIPVPREPVSVASADKIALIAIIPLAWWFTRLCLVGWLGLGMTLFTAAFVALVLCYRKGAGLPITKSSFGWLPVMALSAVNFAVVDNGVIAWLNLLFLMLVVVYWIAALNGSRVEDRLGEYAAADLANHLCVVPFQNFGCFFAVLKKTAAKRGQDRTNASKNAGIVLLTFLCSLPLLWYVCLQLAGVDSGFSDFLRGLSRIAIPPVFPTYTTVLAVPVALYLYGLLYGSQHKRYTDSITKEQLDEAAKKRRVLPTAAVYTVLTLLCLVYALFFVIGAAGMLSFVRSAHGPKEYADFARNGFFELCRVSVVNLLVLLGVSLFGKTSSGRSSAPSRIYHSILCCQTLLLIALALCKMGLYIRFCGVTWLRVCTTWFMVLLAAVFGLILLSQFKTIPLARWTVIAFCALFLVLCWMDVDGLVVKNAVWRYEVLGDAAAISYVDLADSAAAGARELYGLHQRESMKEDSPVLLDLEQLLEKVGYQWYWSVPAAKGFWHWNHQRAAAWLLGTEFLPRP